MTDPEHDNLSERIAKAQADRAAREAKKAAREDKTDGSITAGAMALRYGAEMAGCIVIGLLFGYLIDRFFGTKPWGLLIMLGFGIAAGVLSVIRAYRQLTADANLQGTDQIDGPEDGKKG
ncbi:MULTISPECIES: AtpZ/AtpI family protein [Henriciella]|jgi:ATP synthase protein I|uniref:ATP synthase protein I n=1 Tax=Henriciella pelagia TaxID=1977912 RepID=A0ABQ1JAQ6_9PROT|nr:AtpZ/AtpI family protein [Henriciella pelagia]GGB64028.1 hypothetical protein GCM10011503_10980 [Henriciella pelagia]